MKKAVVLLLLLAVLSLTLCGCKSGEKTYQGSSKPNQSSHEQTSINSSNVSNDSGNTTSSEPYKKGILTTREFYSEWLNLYCDIPLELRLDNDSIETLEKYNKAVSKEGSFIEMWATNSVDSGSTLEMWIYTYSIEKNGNQEAFVKKNYQGIRDAYKKASVNGIQISCSEDNFSTYSFLGEDYLLNTTHTETRRDGKLNRKGTTWDLWRTKGDYIICIQCMVYDKELEKDLELDDYLSMFITYDAHFNPDSVSSTESSSVENSTENNNSDDNSFNSDDTGANSSNGNNNADANSSGSGNNVGNNGGNNSGDKTSAVHTHSYTDATCTEPKTCTVCGATTGSALGHSWEAVESTVHHDQEGHYEMVIVEYGYSWLRCPVCYEEFKSSDSYYSHFDSSHSNVSPLREQYTTGVVNDQYEETWVVDKEAYDETVIVGYKCGKCGATKQ